MTHGICVSNLVNVAIPNRENQQLEFFTADLEVYKIAESNILNNPNEEIFGPYRKEPYKINGRSYYTSYKFDGRYGIWWTGFSWNIAFANQKGILISHNVHPIMGV